MIALLQETLDTIQSEGGEYNKSFDLVDQLLLRYGESDLANRLYSEIESLYPWETVADLFGILIWSTSDNGSALTKVTDNWITECNEERKVSIALHLDTYPFHDAAEMNEKLEKVSVKFPALKNRCVELINSRSSQ